MYPQFTSFSPYQQPSRPTPVEAPKPKCPQRFTNSGQTPFLYWRNYDIIGLDRNTAPAFFSELDRRIHVSLAQKRSIFSSKRPYQTIELRMNIIPYEYNASEIDLYDHETAFFLRCGKAVEWDKWESGILHEFVLGTLPKGCTCSLSQIEVARA